jgi:hypothetical protein
MTSLVMYTKYMSKTTTSTKGKIMATSRDDLKQNALYYEKACNVYFYTPDNDGVIWFDNLRDAQIADFARVYASIQELDD